MTNKTYAQLIKEEFDKIIDRDFIMFLGRFNNKEYAKFYYFRNPKGRSEITRCAEALMKQARNTHEKAWMIKGNNEKTK